MTGPDDDLELEPAPPIEVRFVGDLVIVDATGLDPDDDDGRAALLALLEVLSREDDG